MPWAAASYNEAAGKIVQGYAPAKFFQQTLTDLGIGDGLLRGHAAARHRLRRPQQILQRRWPRRLAGRPLNDRCPSRYLSVNSQKAEVTHVITQNLRPAAIPSTRHSIRTSTVRSPGSLRSASGRWRPSTSCVALTPLRSHSSARCHRSHRARLLDRGGRHLLARRPAVRATGSGGVRRGQNPRRGCRDRSVRPAEPLAEPERRPRQRRTTQRRVARRRSMDFASAITTTITS